MRLRDLLSVLVLSVPALWAAPADADTWPPPETKVYASANVQFRFTVVPARLSDEGSSPIGTLERAKGVGEWRVVWHAPLVNLHAPVNALVTDAGDYVVTFDNWHYLGHGDDAVVVYGAHGKTIASLALSDLMPRSFVETLPRSASSIWWGGDHRFNEGGDELILEVAAPERRGIPRAERYFRIRLELATGRARIVRDQDWNHAMAASARASREADSRRAEREGPLSAPGADTLPAWRAYSREVFLRLSPDWPPAVQETLLVRLPPDRDYMGNVRSIRGMLGHSRAPVRRWPELPRMDWRSPATAFVFASPAPGVLADSLVEEAAILRAGVLEGWRVYVICDPRDAGRLRMALGRLGADVIAVDPNQPIPQRPERLR